MNDPQDEPPEPAPGLTEQDIGFVGASLERIREGGPGRIIEEQAAAVEAGEAIDILDTPHMKYLADRQPLAYRHAYRWRPRFLACLQMAPDIQAAARLSGCHRQTVYDHREADPFFDEAVLAALDVGVGVLVARVHSRAIDGDLKPIYHMGVLVGHERRYDTRLQLALLAAHKPEVYGRATAKAGELVGGEVADALDRLHEAVTTLSPVMLARQIALNANQRPAEIGQDGGFVSLDDVKQAQAKEVAKP